MINFLIAIVINAAALMLAAYLLPKVKVKSWGAAFIVALIFGILNPTIGWILAGVLHVATLGIPFLLGLGFIIRLIVSAIVLKIIDALMMRLKIEGFGTAILVALIMAIVGTVLDWIF